MGISVLGTAIAFIRAQDFLVHYLVLLGITIPPVAAIYIVNILWIRGGHCDAKDLQHETTVDIRAFITWILAIAVGYSSHIGAITLTGVASLDSITAATVFYSILNIKYFRKN